MVRSISPLDLKEKLKSKNIIQLIDIREPYEFEIVNIGGTLIPMSTVIENKDKISKDKQVVIHCKSGRRAAAIVDTLTSQYSYQNVFNLEGGILAYIALCEPSLPIY